MDDRVDDLKTLLRRHWGYDSFRPLQERIVNSLLQDRDVAVVMPTGGGKSLCYQLPALVSGHTAIVISPLISLMQDQAAQLAQMGIPAAVLNSSQDSRAQSQTMRDACQGKFRLLYLSPERLVREDTSAWLARVPVGFFAIDEAHCISEWGHEFRPEYRQLSKLRQQFPDRPIAAFTASATRRVRHDILYQLQLRDPDKYIASFHRPNLRYLVRQCDGKTQSRLLLSALRAHQGSNIIVYAPTIARVEETVDFLAEHGVSAVAYHGQMDAGLRQRNQERWMSDEVPVLVGTVAFGLGINKAAVRAVIHLSLPKSIEQYYQEAGRAGRDGEPADCALLWQTKDAGLLAYFIGKLVDPGEKERSWERYNTIRRFAEDTRCRHRQICLHFGETPKWQSCGMCDVCVAPPDWLSEERKSDSPKPQSRARATEKPVMEADAALIEYMREWRREAARHNGVAAFMVMSDATLIDLCRRHPSNLIGLLSVSGIGVKKAEMYGDEIFAALRAFEGGARAKPVSAEISSPPALETIRLLNEGRTLEEIAQLRSRTLRTVVGMVANLIESGKIEFQDAWVRAEYRPLIEETAARLGTQWLKPLKEALPPEVTFEEIHLIIAKLRAKQSELRRQ